MTGIVIRVTEKYKSQFRSRVGLFPLFCFSSPLHNRSWTSNSLRRSGFDLNSGVAGITTVPQYWSPLLLGTWEFYFPIPWKLRVVLRHALANETWAEGRCTPFWWKNSIGPAQLCTSLSFIFEAAVEAAVDMGVQHSDIMQKEDCALESHLDLCYLSCW